MPSTIRPARAHERRHQRYAPPRPPPRRIAPALAFPETPSRTGDRLAGVPRVVLGGLTGTADGVSPHHRSGLWSFQPRRDQPYLRRHVRRSAGARLRHRRALLLHHPAERTGVGLIAQDALRACDQARCGFLRAQSRRRTALAAECRYRSGAGADQLRCLGSPAQCRDVARGSGGDGLDRTVAGRPHRTGNSGRDVADSGIRPTRAETLACQPGPPGRRCCHRQRNIECRNRGESLRT